MKEEILPYTASNDPETLAIIATTKAQVAAEQAQLAIQHRQFVLSKSKYWARDFVDRSFQQILADPRSKTVQIIVTYNDK